MTLLMRRVISLNTSLMMHAEVFCWSQQMGTVLQEIQDFTEWADTVQTVAMVAVEVIPELNKLLSDITENFNYDGNLD